MSAKPSAELSQTASSQSGVVTRKQAIKATMSARAIEWKVQAGEWQRVHTGVYATFTGDLPRLAQLWAAVLYAGDGAVLSYQSAGELQGLVEKPADVIHVTVPASRRVRPFPGLVIHLSDAPQRLARYPEGEPPMTLVADTVIDLAEACTSVDDVYGWVARAFGRNDVGMNVVDVLVAVKSRKKLRWRAELTEAIVAASGGAHSALELLWDKNVELPHGLPPSRKQVPFAKSNGQVGFRDREYMPWGVIIELDGKKSHSGERRDRDNARDRVASVGSKETLRYGWRETRYEGCQSAAEVIRVLWRRGWRGRPKPCSRDCPVAGLLSELDKWLAADPAGRRQWAQGQATQEAAQQEEAERQAASWKAVHAMVDEVVQARSQVQQPGRPFG
ncbi:MAG TPA: type IV toxin-antitoxin system AbiEi family antitoxin domain-containing protein [Trebonia sp.]